MQSKLVSQLKEALRMKEKFELGDDLLRHNFDNLILLNWIFFFSHSENFYFKKLPILYWGMAY